MFKAIHFNNWTQHNLKILGLIVHLSLVLISFRFFIIQVPAFGVKLQKCRSTQIVGSGSNEIHLLKLLQVIFGGT